MRKTFVLLALILLTSCAGMNNKQAAYVENDNVSVQLAMAAQKASNAVIELAEVEKVRTPTTSAPIVEDVPRLLRRQMSITWNGPIAPLVEKIATRSMYGFVEVGVPHTTPVLVQVDAINTPMIDILRNVGLQAGSRANLVVDTANRNIEVHYVEAR